MTIPLHDLKKDCEYAGRLWWHGKQLDMVIRSWEGTYFPDLLGALPHVDDPEYHDEGWAFDPLEEVPNEA